MQIVSPLLVHDCDFNQMLGLPLHTESRSRVTLSELPGMDLEGKPIMVREDCYGCTAGQGSSCVGALGGVPTRMEQRA